MLIKEKDMSDPGPRDFHPIDVFAPMRASMRTHLGEFVDTYMAAKIDLVRKLQAKILLSNGDDITELSALNTALNDAFMSEDDIKKLEAKVLAVLGILQKALPIWTELKRKPPPEHRP